MDLFEYELRSQVNRSFFSIYTGEFESLHIQRLQYHAQISVAILVRTPRTLNAGNGQDPNRLSR